MTFAKIIPMFALIWTLSMACVPTTSLAAVPAYYHYYYVYQDSMTWCGKLVGEVFSNTDRNWRFTEKKLTETTAGFSVGDVRGFLRCLAKQPKESWVVIITTGNNSAKTRELFEELRLGVCGKCSALVD